MGAARMASLWADRRGQDLVEYSLISGLIAAAALGVMAPSMDTIITSVNGVMSAVNAALLNGIE